MKSPFRVLILAAALIILIGAGAVWLRRSRGGDSLTKYKAELRAKGEKLSAEELGYPRLPERSQGLDRLLVAANKVRTMRFQPSTFDFMPFTGPGRVEPIWSASRPVINSLPGAKGDTNDWATISAQFAKEANITLELREAVRTPPRYFYNDPTNFSNTPKGPFVGIRNAAHWLAGDAVVALREHRLDEAGRDIHALAQLSQFHREDLTLVSQMVRVAVAGLGLSVTWQALQAERWNEELLAAMQKDWEGVNFADVFETAMVGERAFGGAVFAMMRSASSRERMKFPRMNTTAGSVQLGTPKEYFDAYVGMSLWVADVDELFFLEHHQRTLDSIRKLPRGIPWAEVKSELSSHFVELDKAFSSSVGEYRYHFTGVTLPNSLKAAGICVRSETQRRMTVVVIALERYRLQLGAYPSALDALVPRFLSAVPVDPMSAGPLCYRLNPDGTCTLYSVGEDGRDDDGDPTSGSASKQFDLWSGRDAVWPVADTSQ